MTKLPISLVIISLNEEVNVERCIESCPWASEVVLLDSGSTDRTVDLATSKGAKVYIEKFRGYREQKQRATDLAQNNWILSLDADEALSPELSKEIQLLFENSPTKDGYEIPRKSFHMGRWILHGGWHPDRQLRLFNKEKAKWAGGNVHEYIEITSEAQQTGLLKNSILHWVFDDLTDQVDTNNKYSSFGARDLLDRGKKFSILKLITKPISKFLETYVVKRGFLDGLPGFIVAVGAAYSVFLKFSKLWELEQNGRDL